MPSFVQDLLKSRRFWVAVAGVVVVVAKDRLNIPLDEQQLADMCMLITGWLVGESVRSSSLKAA